MFYPLSDIGKKFGKKLCINLISFDNLYRNSIDILFHQFSPNFLSGAIH